MTRSASLLAVVLLVACSSPAPPGFGEPEGDDDANPDDDDAASDDDDASAPPCTAWGVAEGVATVEDDGLSEISGIAVSRRHDDLLWVHEDSGRPPVLTALGTDGQTRGTLTLTGVDNADWEDIAAGPCGDETCLFVGEFGDNGASRDDYAILRVVEPTFDTEPFALEVAPDVLPYTYAGGSRDAEGLAVDPGGRPVVVDKVDGGFATIHRFEELLVGEQVVLEEVATIPTGTDGSGGLAALPTAADLHPDGDRLLVRTYADLWEFDLDGVGLEGAGDAPRAELEHGLELQGEAAAYAPDGRAVWHVAEWGNPTLYRIPCVDGR